MTTTPSLNGSAGRAPPSLVVAGPRAPLPSRKLPFDLLVGLGFLVFALLLHMARCRPEGTWRLEPSAGAEMEVGVAGTDAQPVTGTLRLEPSGRYRLDIAAKGASAREAQGYWAANHDGFELHEGSRRLGRFGSFASPIAGVASDGTASLTFPGGESWSIRRIRDR